MAVSRRVTTSGGEYPAWSRDSRELYYIDREQWLVALPMRPGPAIEPGTPVRLFVRARGEFTSAFEVDAKGRFLVYAVDMPRTSSGLMLFNAVLNWPALARGRQ